MLPRFDFTPGCRIPRLIRGTWQLHEAARSLDRATAIDDLIAGCEAGLTTIEAADIYDGVEELLGELRVALAGGQELRVHTRVSQVGAVPLAPEDVRARVDRSRRRLRQERLDLVQLQWWNLDLPGWIAAGQKLAELQRAGAVAQIGVANFPAWAMTALLDAGVPLICNQVQMSLIDPRASLFLVPACRARGIHLLAYGPLAGGFLSDAWLGQPEPGTRPVGAQRFGLVYRKMLDRFGGWSWLQRLLAVMSQCAARHRVDIAAIALAWLLHKGEAAALLVGLSNSRRLPSFVHAASMELSSDELAAIDAVVAQRSPVDGDVGDMERRELLGDISSSYAAAQRAPTPLRF